MSSATSTRIIPPVSAFGRIQDAGITYYADPACQKPDQLYTNGARRGTYFRDPDGHLMEILTPLG
jgi:catechol 2,3-dioxygenase-like lactoylglutathione lyase family enzyme